MKKMLCIIVLLSFYSCSKQEVSTVRPNVLFILSDDQAWGDYGFMGHETVKTPHLDKLASQSLLFKRGYVTAPLCRPSLASMATGLYLHQHEVVGNDVCPRWSRVSPKVGRQQIVDFNKNPCVVSELVKNGYLAFQSGKWWEGSWKEAHFTSGMTHGDIKKGGRHGDQGLSIGRKGIQPIKDFVDDAVKQKKPFYIWYAPFLPHSPHNPPQRLLEKYSKGRPKDEAQYFAMCEWFDETCGEIITYLEKKKIKDNTLIVYACDNGWVAKSRSDVPVPKNWDQKYAPRSKGSPYENGIRTPIMFSFPKKIKAQDAKDLAITIDLLPTILKFCSVDLPSKKLPGLDLLNVKARQKRQHIFGAAHSIYNMTVGEPEETLQYQWVITKRYKYLKRFHGKDTTHYKFVHLWDQTPEHLFDLTMDPSEKKNLINKYPGVLKGLKAQLKTFNQ